MEAKTHGTLTLLPQFRTTQMADFDTYRIGHMQHKNVFLIYYMQAKAQWESFFLV
jgi:hypothetical protein